MEDHRFIARWAVWAAVACLLSGAVAPYAGFADLLMLALGDPPNPYFYVLSWACLGLGGTLATNGFTLHFARRNRKSIRAGCVCSALFALSWLPVFSAIDSMRRTVAALGAARPPEDSPDLTLQRTPATGVSAARTH